MLGCEKIFIRSGLGLKFFASTSLQVGTWSVVRDKAYLGGRGRE